jgi:DNA-binding transcriptional regulator of glucitol operon
MTSAVVFLSYFGRHFKYFVLNSEQNRGRMPLGRFSGLLAIAGACAVFANENKRVTPRKSMRGPAAIHAASQTAWK